MARENLERLAVLLYRVKTRGITIVQERPNVLGTRSALFSLLAYEKKPAESGRTLELDDERRNEPSGIGPQHLHRECCDRRGWNERATNARQLQPSV